MKRSYVTAICPECFSKMTREVGQKFKCKNCENQKKKRTERK